MSAHDAVDGSSTGTRVPSNWTLMWGYTADDTIFDREAARAAVLAK